MEGTGPGYQPDDPIELACTGIHFLAVGGLGLGH